MTDLRLLQKPILLQSAESESPPRGLETLAFKLNTIGFGIGVLPADLKVWMNLP